jgi:hypothetical protein
MEIKGYFWGDSVATFVRCRSAVGRGAGIWKSSMTDGKAIRLKRTPTASLVAADGVATSFSIR